MGAPNRLRRLKRMAATSMVLMGGTVAISPQLLDGLLEEAERIAQEDGDCVRVLRVLAQDARPGVRALVAEALGVLSPDAAPSAILLLRDLARDSSSHVRSAVALGLAQRIDRASPAERIELVCEWVLSPETSARAAIARALTWPTAVFITDLVIEQLASDEDAEVRALALQAAAAHLTQDPNAYTRLARERLSDPDQAVRHAAASVLDRLV